MSGLFSAPKVQTTTVAAPPAPTVTPPAPMPDTDSPAVTEANRKAQQDIIARAGRQSTILTTPKTRSQSGGTNYDSYSGSTLG